MNLADSLSTSAVRNPRKTAVILGHERLSYEQLEYSSESLARWLLQRGYKPGDRIALHWPNSVEMVKLLFACFRAGMIAVPVNVRLKAPEVANIIEHSKAAICFAHTDLVTLTEQACQNVATRPGLLSSLPDVNDENADFALPKVGPDRPALILYTSGTTARPKGVTHTHRTLLESVRIVCGAAPDSLQTCLVMTQMAYVSGVSFALLPAIVTGATCVLVPSFEPGVVLDMIDRFQCTYTLGLPVMVQSLVEEQVRNPRQVHSLRTFLAGGDSVPTILQQRFQSLFGIPLREAYGMTETGLSLSNPADSIRPGSLGKPFDGVDVRVVDSRGVEVSDSQTGEIAVRSPANFTGYWDDPAATQDTFRGGWLHTGDLAHRDADGYLWFDGRKKEIIVRDALNLSPQEIEEVLYDHPAVLEVAVIGAPDPLPARGEQVVAFVRLREGMVATESELRTYASQRLADFKVPTKFVFSESLPKGITGKIQRRALKETLSSSLSSRSSARKVATAETHTNDNQP
jgi:long-chain acyl-CoA synthetase